LGFFDATEIALALKAWKLIFFSFKENWKCRYKLPGIFSGPYFWRASVYLGQTGCIGSSFEEKKI